MPSGDASAKPGKSRGPRVGFLRLTLAEHPHPRPWTRAAGGVLDPERAREARALIRAWPGYARTPLLPLPGLVERLGVAEVWCKDESGRFGIGSFKALGGAYAVLRTLQADIRRRTGRAVDESELLAGAVPEAGGVTVVSASAGNHGRSVAWGAERLGCRCVVILPRSASAARAAAIESHGAEVVRFPGDYDGAVAHAAAEAEARGWLVVSDTAYARYEEIPRRIYEGYTLLGAELLAQLEEVGATPPTHVIVQAGVGGLATGVCGHLWHTLGVDRPRFVAVEALQADGLARSLRAGAPARAPGPFTTVMGGLAAGVPSPVAWRLLEGCLDAALGISDAHAEAARAALACGELGASIDAGPSGAAGVGAALALARLPTAKELLDVDERSRIGLLVTETRFE